MNLTGPSWRKLTLRELRLLSTVAYQVGGAVERERLTAEGTRLARARSAPAWRGRYDTLAQDRPPSPCTWKAPCATWTAAPSGPASAWSGPLSTTRESLVEARRSVLNLRASPWRASPWRRPWGPWPARSRRRRDPGPGHRLRAAGPCGPLPLRTEAELFRIAQEALTNVRKHAQARTVDITLRARGAGPGRRGHPDPGAEGGTRAGAEPRGAGGEGEGGGWCSASGTTARACPPRAGGPCWAGVARRARGARGSPERDSGGSGHGHPGDAGAGPASWAGPYA